MKDVYLSFYEKRPSQGQHFFCRSEKKTTSRTILITTTRNIGMSVWYDRTSQSGERDWEGGRVHTEDMRYEIR